MIQHTTMKMTYRGILRTRSRADTRQWRIIGGVSELIQYLSERFGLMQLLANAAAIVAVALLAVPCAILATVARIVGPKIVRRLNNEQDCRVTFSLPWRSRRDEWIITVYVVDSPVDMTRLRVVFKECAISHRLFKSTRTCILGGCVHLWRQDGDIGNFHLSNHLIELSPMWKHRLVTEETADVRNSTL